MAQMKRAPRDELQPTALIARQIGAWRVARHVATGAMGWIFAVTRESAPHGAAILKLLRPGLNSTELRARFQREVAIMRHLADFGGIPRVFDNGALDDGLPFFVMESAAGAAADIFCDAANAGLRRRIDLVAEFAAIVAALHARGVAHGDLKPENALAGEEGVRLIDFGTGRIFDPPALAAKFALPSDGGSQICTPQYASPEQLAGQLPSARSDVHGLGALAYALLAGRPPRERGGRSMAQFATHAAGTQVELLTAVCADRWRVDADVAALGAVAKVIATALEPDPGRRFGSALEFRRALRAALGTR